MTVNEKNGVRYGFVHADRLDQWIVNEEIIPKALEKIESQAFQEGWKDFIAEKLQEWFNESENEKILEMLKNHEISSHFSSGKEPGFPQDWCAFEDILDDLTLEDVDEDWLSRLFFDTGYGAEGSVEIDLENVTIIASNISGYWEFTIVDSPYKGYYALCSPCCPGGGDLHTPLKDGNKNTMKTYTVPPDWWSDKQVFTFSGVVTHDDENYVVEFEYGGIDFWVQHVNGIHDVNCIVYSDLEPNVHDTGLGSKAEDKLAELREVTVEGDLELHDYTYFCEVGEDNPLYLNADATPYQTRLKNTRVFSSRDEAEEFVAKYGARWDVTSVESFVENGGEYGEN